MEMTFKLRRRQKIYPPTKKGQFMILEMSAMKNLKQSEGPREQRGGGGCCLAQASLRRALRRVRKEVKKHVWRKSIQALGIASAKAPRQECAGCL